MDDNAKWCLNLYNMLNDNGLWAIPRSGMIIAKRPGGLMELVMFIPHEDAMPISAEELLEQQRGEWQEFCKHCKTAGIKTRDKTGTFSNG